MFKNKKHDGKNQKLQKKIANTQQWPVSKP